MTRITKEWRLPTGLDANGKLETMAVGFRIEDDFGGGNVRQRLKLHVSVLNPVLFQMVKPFMDKGSSYVYLDAVDFTKRYKDAVQAEMPPQMATEAEVEEGGDQ
jgi:hypothetical protein